MTFMMTIKECGSQTRVFGHNLSQRTLRIRLNDKSFTIFSIFFLGSTIHAAAFTVRYEFGMGAIEVVCDHVTTAPRWPVRDIGPGVVGCSEYI